MEITKTNPDDYINSLPAELKTDIARLDAEIVKAVPGISRVMWEGKFWGGSDQKIIGYGEYSYTGSNKKTGTWFKIGLAQQKNYITVFLNAVDGKEYVAEKYKPVLGKVKVGRSSISFKSVEDINLDKLIEAIKRGYEIMSKPRD